MRMRAASWLVAEKAKAPVCSAAAVMAEASAVVDQPAFCARTVLPEKMARDGRASAPVTPNCVKAGPAPRIRTRLGTEPVMTKPAIKIVSEVFPAIARVERLMMRWSRGIAPTVAS